jgi:hypothetical protein
MRREPEQFLALGERLSHQRKIVMFEIAKPAMDQFGRGGRGRAAEVALLHQEHCEPPARRVAGDAAAVYSAADNRKIIVGHYASPGGAFLLSSSLMLNDRNAFHKLLLIVTPA